MEGKQMLFAIGFGIGMIFGAAFLFAFVAWLFAGGRRRPT
jgi:hypothetical protein